MFLTVSDWLLIKEVSVFFHNRFIKNISFNKDIGDSVNNVFSFPVDVAGT